MRYIKEYIALSGDSDTNAFTLNAPELIEARALSTLFLTEGHDGREMRQFWKQEETDQFDAMKLITYQRTGTGNLDTEPFFNNIEGHHHG